MKKRATVLILGLLAIVSLSGNGIAGEDEEDVAHLGIRFSESDPGKNVTASVVYAGVGSRREAGHITLAVMNRAPQQKGEPPLPIQKTGQGSGESLPGSDMERVIVDVLGGVGRGAFIALEFGLSAIVGGLILPFRASYH